MSTVQMAYGCKNGRIIHISEVPRGDECGCTCLACGAALTAKKGPQVAHHFAHRADEFVIPGSCTYNEETALHLAAKETLLRFPKLFLPDVMLSDSGMALGKYDRCIGKGRVINFQYAALEGRQEGFVPDVTLLSSNGRKLFVEIRVSHQVDEEKAERMRALGVSALEVDVRPLIPVASLTSIDEIAHFLVSGKEYVKWIFNAYAYEKARDIKISTVPLTMLNGDPIAEGCPFDKRSFYDISYAYTLIDCRTCKYNIAGINHYGNISPIEQNAPGTGTMYKLKCLGAQQSHRENLRTIDLYVFGSWISSSRSGGWAYVLRDGDSEYCDAQLERTVQHQHDASLIALERGLKKIRGPCRVVIHTYSPKVFLAMAPYDYQGKPLSPPESLASLSTGMIIEMNRCRPRSCRELEQCRKVLGRLRKEKGIHKR